MATKSTTTTKKNSATGSSTKKQPTTTELREWYSKYNSRIEKFERSQNALQLLDPSSNTTKTFNTFSKETLRTYMKNPLAQYKNLRNLSRFLYYRSQVYRRIIHYNANMIDLDYRSVIPLIDLVKGSDATKVLKSYYETLSVLEKMNLNLALLPAYITCFREDVFFGCVYYDDEGFFILPLDPDYCKITSIYPTGDFGFDFDMSYFNRKQDILEFWGSPWDEMWREYQKNTTENRWVPMKDENCICFKYNIDDWETPIPPYIGLFANLINLEDLSELTAISDEQQIYKLLATKIPLISNSDNPDDFAVDIDTAIGFYNKMKETLPDYANAVILPGMDLDTISFDHDQTTDVNKIENATKAVLNTSGGAQVLNSSSISGSTSWEGAIKADEDFALSSLLPQTESWINRFLSYQVSDPAKVRFLEVTTYTVDKFRDNVIKSCTYGVPNKLLLGTLNGFTELETLSLNFLENDILKLHEKFIPLQSSNTQNTGEIGRPTADESGESITEDGEASQDKRDRAN